MIAAAAADPGVFLARLEDYQWALYRAVMVARIAVPLSLGLLIPAQRDLHPELFPAIVALWVALCLWVIVTGAYARPLFDLLRRNPRWLWVEEALVLVLLIVGGGWRNVFYYYASAPVIFASLFVSSRMAIVLATVNSLTLFLAFGVADLIGWDPAIEEARVTEWWAAITGYYVAAGLFAYVRRLFDRLREAAEAYRDTAVALGAAEREAVIQSERRDLALRLHNQLRQLFPAISLRISALRAERSSDAELTEELARLAAIVRQADEHLDEIVDELRLPAGADG